ncbi:MAG TPA: hypothetical protein PLZ61_01715 [Candidatus Cryosericum sp.]|nr:hypothetical protein [Candidatus Cryosericum sp.]
MDAVVTEGLRVSLTSYLLIFGVLGVFYILIKLLWKMPPPKEGS